jgi:hypothetical protein
LIRLHLPRWQTLCRIILVLAVGISAACGREAKYDLLSYPNAQYWIDSTGEHQGAPPANGEWKTFDKQALKDMPADTRQRTWVAMPLPPDRTYILLSGCRNLLSIFQEDIALDSDERQFGDIGHGEPIPARPSILRLPLSQGSSTLYLKTIYSRQVGYAVDCQLLEVTTKEDALRGLLSQETNNVIVGYITLFLGLAGLIMFIFKPQKVLLYFSSFATGMAGVYLFGTDIYRLNPDYLWPFHIYWHMSVGFAPIPFFLFFNEVMRPPWQLTRWIAYLNAGVLGIMILLYLTPSHLTLADLRQYYFPFLAIELLLIPPLAVVGILQRRPFAKLFSAGVILIACSAIHDINTLLYKVNSKGEMILPWVLVAFVSLLLLVMIQLAIGQEATIEKQAGQLLIDRNRSLLIEVERRTSDLNKRSQELERLHRELEERHELLLEQRRHMVELAEEKDLLLHQIYEIRQKTLPSILNHMQKLHTQSDPDELRVLGDDMDELHQVLERVAKLYTQRIHIRNRRILILDPDKKNQRGYKLSLGGSKMELTLISSSNELWAHLDQKHYEMIGVHQDFFEVIDAIRARQKECSILLLSSSDDSRNLKYLFDTHGPLQVIPLNLPRSLLQKILLIHVTKLVSKDIFGIEKYLVWGSAVKERPLPEIQDQELLVTAIRRDLEGLGLEEAAVRRLGEMCRSLMEIERSNRIVQSSGSNAKETVLQQVRYGYDANFMLISIDLQGQLISRESLLGLLCGHQQEGGTTIPGMTRLFELADAITLNTNGRGHHELMAIVHPEYEHQATQTAAFYYFGVTSNNDLQ